METRKPRRPAIIEPETLEYLEGEEDPALSSESAHTSARILVKSPNGEWSDPEPETKERLLAFMQGNGVDELAELWSRSPVNTLPGVLWRLLLIDQWVKRYPEGVNTRFKQGLNSPQLSEYLDIDGAHSLDFPAWKKQLEQILSGSFDDNFADFLDRSQAVLRVLAASESVWMKKDSTNPLANEVTLRDNALLVTADELLDAAAMYREGRLD
ncbi:hypothetical protein [Mobiluncus curtisii]|uniref:Uncharacterized protein n=1 Tax=Mobiluncus curtisii TaxID=2051 RepID=A0A7Y0YBM3_9ACTO|nr:hypothetical protein [Mobiluncus curtisii]MCU9986752.1 hypothetical protein [Mobiluncus curtisii]MCU9999653.1 hypothetical protein [Mobiluncus curtisii]NMW45128.1 hypothetical protein [Mobiluncus curtisii]NMW49368.1 hypothetical protein [Mobiluncus curtisii]NMW86485.1 hypothetical protein [Mobiluncus curtisii]